MDFLEAIGHGSVCASDCEVDVGTVAPEQGKRGEREVGLGRARGRNRERSARRQDHEGEDAGEKKQEPFHGCLLSGSKPQQRPRGR